VILHNVEIPDHYLSMMGNQCCQNCQCGGDPWNCVAMKIVMVWRDANDNPSFDGNTEWFCDGYEPKEVPKMNVKELIDLERKKIGTSMSMDEIKEQCYIWEKETNDPESGNPIDMMDLVYDLLEAKGVIFYCPHCNCEIDAHDAEFAGRASREWICDYCDLIVEWKEKEKK